MHAKLHTAIHFADILLPAVQVARRDLMINQLHYQMRQTSSTTLLQSQQSLCLCTIFGAIQHS